MNQLRSLFDYYFSLDSSIMFLYKREFTMQISNTDSNPIFLQYLQENTRD